MTAFPKADVQNVRIMVEPNVCLWPKADGRWWDYFELRER